MKYDKLLNKIIENDVLEILTSANGYTDTKASETLTSANNYTDTKSSETLTSANLQLTICLLIILNYINKM